MNTYTVTEKQNMNSYRDGVEIEADSLSQAKRKATRMQCFFGTVLEITQHGETVAVKNESGKWV